MQKYVFQIFSIYILKAIINFIRFVAYLIDYMLKLRKRIFFVFLLFCCITAQSQAWILQKNVPDYGFTSIYALDSAHVWAIGATRISKYNGKEWKEEFVDYHNGGAKVITFTDSLHGWAAGNGGQIYKYTNHKWLKDTIFSSRPYYAIHFCDTNHGWAVKWGEISYFKYGQWKNININSPNNSLSSVFALDSNHVWTGTAGQIYKLNGIDLTLDYNYTSSSSSHYPIFKSICFVDSVHGWSVGNGNNILSYDNNGWKMNNLSLGYELLSLSFLNKDLGWCVGQGVTLKYQNGNWIYYSNIGGNCVSFSDEKNGWLAAISGVYKFNPSYKVDLTDVKATVSIWPNPSSDFIHLENLNPQEYNAIEIYYTPIFGQKLY